ncbi:MULTISPECIES: DUF1569 domain-containing protein [unclassified Chryseobacterium]|uniref:DUF1569 domain-containing protein n=1 Tax=unclassified Chryseobacterium TaxID=2593645 RepID=UPI001E433C1D|nr:MULTISPECIES: DUF1569 domain-containing protein [unclassified Chryseobacterium]
MVKKSLHNPEDFKEIINRISCLKENSPKKWGKMNVSQMMRHCSDVLLVPQKKVILPSIHSVFRWIGIATKIEMQIFNNGIPRNMPTFRKLIVNFECDFDAEKENLLKILCDYRHHFENGNLPLHHELFGRMKEKDWGFLEYKHLDHHLKQFGT